MHEHSHRFLTKNILELNEKIEEVNYTLEDIFDVFANNTGNVTGEIDEEKAVNNWWALIAIMLVVCTAAGNVLVCLAIYLERRLQNVTNYFLMSLAITDLLVAILVMPLGILTLLRGKIFVYMCSLPFRYVTIKLNVTSVMDWFYIQISRNIT
ncbi:hypothetical protein SFRURICE_001170 [Spodoptera frugiperda]|nr:hypothetical protein SFRURICE_001170 [Spodoptera frugiperda]